MNQEGVGLRERKRLQTQFAIESAAVNLCFERGLDGVTVAEISEAADVSSRTFFNHFASKEDAVLGVSRTPPPEGEIDLALAGSSVEEILASIEAYAARLFSVLGISSALVRRRFTLLRQHPELAARQAGQFLVFEEALIARIAGQLSQSADPGVSKDEARMVVLLAGTALRYATHSWAESDADRPLAEIVPEAFRLLRATAQRSAAPSPAGSAARNPSAGAGPDTDAPSGYPA